MEKKQLELVIPDFKAAVPVRFLFQSWFAVRNQWGEFKWMHISLLLFHPFSGETHKNPQLFMSPGDVEQQQIN